MKYSAEGRKQLFDSRRSWDWTKSDCQLGLEHGLTSQTVCKTRHELGIPRWMPPPVKITTTGRDRTNLKTEATFIPFNSLDMSAIERFWASTHKAGPDECWPWKGGKSKGYGRITLHTPSGKAQFQAHRVSYLLHNRELPTNLLVMHSCDNPQCVNPNHLTLGTDLENTLDASKKLRMHPGERTFGAVLTEELIKHIRFCHSRGEQINSIARRIAHHRRTVADVVNNKTWRHVQ